MSVFLEAAAVIITTAIPLLVITLLIAVIGCGGVVLLQGLVTKKLVRAAVGAVVLAAGLGAGLTVVNWATIKPSQSTASGIHALVFESWQQTRARFWERGRLANEAGANKRLSED